MHWPSPEVREAYKRARASYLQSEKGQRVRDKYRKSPKGLMTAAEYSRKWRQEHPGYFTARDRNRRMRRKYGMTSIEVEEMLRRQGGKCALPDCTATTPNHETGWRVDHDPLTGRVRGLVCHPCNIAVGYYEKSQHRFLAFDRYISTGKDS